MKLRHYLSLYPRNWLALQMVMLLAIAELGSGIIPRDRPDLVDGLFLLNVLLLPLCFGVVTAIIWKTPQHRPQAWLLPGLQPQLLRWQVAGLAMAGIFLAWVFQWAEPTFPPAAAFALIFGMLTLPLPFERGFWLAQARWPFLGLLGLAAVAATFRAETRALLLAHPWPAATVGGLVATASLALACSRDALRRRADSADLLWMDPDQMRQHMLRDRQRRGVPASSRFMAKSWHYQPRGNSLISWIRAQREVQPGNKFLLDLVTTGGGLFFYLLITLITRGTRGFPGGWYDWTFQPAGERDGAQGTFLILFMLMPTFANRTAPDAGIFYPLARGRRAGVAFVGAALNLATLFGTLVAALLGVGVLSGLWLHEPTPLPLILGFVVRIAASLPFIPLLQWTVLRYPSPVPRVLWSIPSLVGAQLASGSILNGGLGWGAVICVIGMVVSQAAFFLALRRRFITGDLMTEGTPRRCLGLV